MALKKKEIVLRKILDVALEDYDYKKYDIIHFINKDLKFLSVDIRDAVYYNDIYEYEDELVSDSYKYFKIKHVKKKSYLWILFILIMCYSMVI